jgi:hypothetical protein
VIARHKRATIIYSGSCLPCKAENGEKIKKSGQIVMPIPEAQSQIRHFDRMPGRMPRMKKWGELAGFFVRLERVTK